VLFLYNFRYQPISDDALVDSESCTEITQLKKSGDVNGDHVQK